MLLLALLPPGDLYLGKVIGQIAGATVNMVLIIRIVVGAWKKKELRSPYSFDLANYLEHLALELDVNL